MLFSISSPLEPRTFKAKELWEKNGAVIMAVRRPGCFLCREVSAFENLFRAEDSNRWGFQFPCCRPSLPFIQLQAVLFYLHQLFLSIGSVPVL